MLEIAEGVDDKEFLFYPIGALIVVSNAYFPWIPDKFVVGAFYSAFLSILLLGLLKGLVLFYGSFPWAGAIPNNDPFGLSPSPTAKLENNDVVDVDKDVAGDDGLIPFIYVGWTEEICLFAVGGASSYSPESTIYESASFSSYFFGYYGIVGIKTFFDGPGGILSVKDVVGGLFTCVAVEGGLVCVGSWDWVWAGGLVCPALRPLRLLMLGLCICNDYIFLSLILGGSLN